MSGDRAKAEQFEKEENKLIELLVEQLWDGETFQVRMMHDEHVKLPEQSLIQYIPLLLGAKLPRPFVDRLLVRYEAQAMLTTWGPATESPNSVFYEDDGYWRGPIWAPTTLLIAEAFLAQAEEERARDIMQKYQRLCETSGMAENFDARSGAGLRDKAFAWTSAVYLRFAQLLANDFGEET